MHGSAERPLEVHLGDHRRNAAHVADRHVQPVDRAPVVARQCEVDAGQRGHRAAGAEQADVLRVGRKHVDEAVEAAPRALAHAPVRGEPVRALDRLAALALGQRHHAPRRRPPGDDAGRFLAMVDQHQFGRSAADVENQRRPAAGLEQFVTAQYGEPRFFLGRDDLERDPGLVAHPVDEFLAIFGTAARLGRDRARQGDVAAAQFVGADRQGADRAVHRRVAKPAADRQVPRQGGRFAKRRRRR